MQSFIRILEAIDGLGALVRSLDVSCSFPQDWLTCPRRCSRCVPDSRNFDSRRPFSSPELRACSQPYALRSPVLTIATVFLIHSSYHR